MLKSGWRTDEMLKCFGIEKFNPYHLPAGTPKGGQFTTAERASHPVARTNRDRPRSKDNPEGYVDNDSVNSDIVTTDAISGVVGL